MSLPPTIAANAAITKQAAALSMIKQQANADKAMVSVLEEAALNVPTSSVRGTQVNLSA